MVFGDNWAIRSLPLGRRDAARSHVVDGKLRARLPSTVPEAQVRKDLSDLANWTRGDRKVPCFEQTAQRPGRF